MSSPNEQFQIIYSMERDLCFFSSDEHIHLGILEDKNQRQLGKLIKKVLQHIHQVKKYDQQNVSTTIDNRHSATRQQQTILNDFFQQKHTQQLYQKLKDIKSLYQDLMQDQQIQILENDMERYQQLQKLHSLSTRLDVYDQVYDELHHLRRGLISICRNWTLDRIQHIVNNIIAAPSSSSSLSSTPIPSPAPCKKLSTYQKHRTFFGFLKWWSKLTATTTTATENKYCNNNDNPLSHFNSYSNHQHQHPHLLCINEEQGRQLIMQIIQDFQQVFEENVYQNEQRMYQLYPRVFQQSVDPMLAHDIQHIYLSARATLPPSLTSLTPSGISSVCSWTSDTIHALFFNTQHESPIEFNDIIQQNENTQQSSSKTPLSSQPKNGSIWINRLWGKRKQQQQQHQQQHQQQQPDLSTTLCQHYYFRQPPQLNDNNMDTSASKQEKMWSVCLDRLSEHLLHVGQKYYTQWIQEIGQCQDKQFAPYQLATETMTATYRALQIEHGYSILSRICHQLESIGI